MTVKFKNFTGEVVVAIADDIALILAVLLIPESEILALEVKKCLQVTLTIAFHVRKDNTSSREFPWDIHSEITLLGGGFHTHQSIVDMRVGSGINIESIHQMHHIVNSVPHFLADVFGVDVEEGFHQGCGGVPVGNQRIALEGTHLVEGVDVDYVLSIVE